MGVDIAVEEQFGPYLVYERLGVGGMATVHRALERGIEGFERIVALKRLLPHLAEDASFIKSFVREAKLASLLNHVNIVQIFELGRVGTEYFISMEYIDGRDIRRILRHARKVTGPPPIHVTVGLMLQLCEALDFAHAKTDEAGHPLGLVHRDVSPSNLLVTSAGHLKVIDFGIAKAQSQQLRTQTGRVKGKLAYMAPEAVSGKDLDARSDLFAAGVILHELLTARPLFASKNEYQTLLKVQRGDIMPPSTFNQACPPELDAIALRALARDPDLRYSTAGAMRDELNLLRREFNLQTGHRDVAQWLDWAFTIEAPSGAGPTPDPDRSAAFDVRIAQRTPGPRRDDDEAVEIAWGGGEAVAESGPVLLDDVPDVSGKHLAPAVTPGYVTGDSIPALPPPPRRGATPLPRAATVQGTGAFPAERPSDRLREELGAVTTHARSPSDLSLRGDDSSVRAVEPRLPEVRFRTPTNPPTSPAMPRHAIDALAGDGAIPRPPRAAEISIGASIIERRSRSKTWLLLAGLGVAGAAATAVTLFATRGDKVDPVDSRTGQPPGISVPRTSGTVKFVTEPDDARITIVGAALDHVGSPWSIELAPGLHQIQIERGGYKAWLTSIELSSNETQTLRVVLEPISNAALAAEEATLILSSTPNGLDVVLDGKVLPQKTPLKWPMAPGPHTIALRQAGVEVWRQEVDAKPAADYEFSPSMAEDKRRERAARAARPVVDAVSASVPTDAAPAPIVPTPTDATARPTVPGADKTVERPAVAAEPRPAPTALAPTPAAPPPPTPLPAVTTQVKPVPVAPPRAAGPVLVPPSAVTKLAGAMPTVGKSKRGEVPPVVAAKVCIDTSGRVSNVQMISKLERVTSLDLANALETWKYAPYKQGGVATPACFVVSFRVR